MVAFGDLQVLEHYNDKLRYRVTIRRIARPEERQKGVLNVMDSGLLTGEEITTGRINAKSGWAAREHVLTATRAALSGEIPAVVTLPMCKEAAQLSNPDFVGHTELIGGICGVKGVTIMLVSDQLIVTHVSTHVSLGLPIVRTSVDNGTAFDIACQGVASTRSLIQALELAAKLATP